MKNLNRAPRAAIRVKCLDCCLGSSLEVKLCTCHICALHPLRIGKPIEGISSERCSSLKTIRTYCLGCGEGTYKAVKECEFIGCPLYVYRFGKNPNRKLNLTDEEREKRAKRMRERMAQQKSKHTEKVP